MKSLFNRTIFLSMIIGIILVAPVLSEDTESKLGPPPGKYKMLTDNGRAEIPFTIFGGDIHFRAEINGREVYMLLDDGYMWDQLLFWGSPEVDSLGFDYDGEIGIGGGNEDENLLKSKTASGITVTLPDVEFSQQIAIITPYSSGNSSMWSGSVGQFSASFFKHFIVDINFDKKIITLIKPDKFEYSGSGVSIPWTPSEFGTWKIPGTLNLADGRKVSLDIAMDLGYNTQLEIKTFGETKIPVPEKSLPEALGMNILGQVTTGYVGRLPQIKIGGYEINEVIADYVSGEPSEEKTYEVMIGLGLLSRFNLIFDFYGQKMLIEPNKSFGDPFEYDMSGLVMRKGKNDYYTVRQVHENSPASEADIKIGDKIYKINGKPASEFDHSKLDSLFLLEGKTISLHLLMDGGEEKELSIVLRRLI